MRSIALTEFPHSMVSKFPSWVAKAGPKELRKWSKELEFGYRQFFTVDSRIIQLILRNEIRSLAIPTSMS